MCTSPVDEYSLRQCAATSRCVFYFCLVGGGVGDAGVYDCVYHVCMCACVNEIKIACASVCVRECVCLFVLHFVILFSCGHLSHCAPAFSLRVPKSCTDLNLTILYISIPGTYSKFVRKNKMKTLGVCVPHPFRALDTGLLRQDIV